MSDSQALNLNVMIQVSQLVWNSQLCHSVTKSLNRSVPVSVSVLTCVCHLRLSGPGSAKKCVQCTVHMCEEYKLVQDFAGYTN